MKQNNKNEKNSNHGSSSSTTMSGNRKNCAVSVRISKNRETERSRGVTLNGMRDKTIRGSQKYFCVLPVLIAGTAAYLLIIICCCCCSCYSFMVFTFFPSLIVLWHNSVANKKESKRMYKQRTNGPIDSFKKTQFSRWRKKQKKKHVNRNNITWKGRRKRNMYLKCRHLGPSCVLLVFNTHQCVQHSQIHPNIRKQMRSMSAHP